MKIAETILEFKESTKEIQGDIFSRIMVSVANGRNILEREYQFKGVKRC
jgi:hypothetical protein